MKQMESGGCLKVGYLVALTVQRDSSPDDVYVGSIQEIDDRGVRLTLLDWLIGRFSGWDFFAPWAIIQSVMVATPQHNTDDFADDAAAWQKRMNESRRVNQ